MTAQPPEPWGRDSDRRWYLAALGVALLAGLVYLPSLANSFVNWDDPYYVYDNPHIRALDWQFVRWALFDFHAANWHPLTWLSHALDYALWGERPLGHHLTNTLLHAVNAGLVVLVVARLTEAAGLDPQGRWEGRASLPTAALTGLLWAVHPLHVESVAWVAERKDLLCALFFLLSLRRYLDHDDRALAVAPSSRRPLATCLVYFLLALLSKPMAVSLPLVLLVLDYYPLRRLATSSDVRPLLREKLPFFALSLGSALLTLAAQQESLALTNTVPVVQRLLVASHSLMAYLGKILLPLDLVPYYPYPQSIHLSADYLLALVGVMLISGACLLPVVRRRYPWWPALWAYYLLTMLPVIGIVQAGFQAMADRYAYLPSLGPCLGLGLVWAPWFGRRPRAGAAGRGAVYRLAVGLGLFTAVALLLAGLTVRQIGVWRDSLTLWTYVLDREGDSVPVAYLDRGAAYAAQGRLALAIDDYSAAIRLLPRYAAAYRNRGLAFKQQGDLERALGDFSTAIGLKPADPDLYLSRAVAYDSLGRFDQALADYERVLALAPDTYQASNNRGLLRVRQGRLPEAIADFSAAIARQPGEERYYSNRGRCYAALGDYPRALADYGQALAINARYVTAYENRAEVYLASHRQGLALRDLQAACGLGSRAACDRLRSLAGERDGGR